MWYDELLPLRERRRRISQAYNSLSISTAYIFGRVVPHMCSVSFEYTLSSVLLVLLGFFTIFLLSIFNISSARVSSSPLASFIKFFKKKKICVLSSFSSMCAMPVFISLVRLHCISGSIFLPCICTYVPPFTLHVYVRVLHLSWAVLHVCTHSYKTHWIFFLFRSFVCYSGCWFFSSSSFYLLSNLCLRSVFLTLQRAKRFSFAMWVFFSVSLSTHATSRTLSRSGILYDSVCRVCEFAVCMWKSFCTRLPYLSFIGTHSASKKYCVYETESRIQFYIHCWEYMHNKRYNDNKTTHEELWIKLVNHYEM